MTISAPEKNAVTETKTLELMEAFAAAYNRHDVDGIMELMTGDCSFVSYFGPDACGQRFDGCDAVRKRVTAGLHDFPDSRWEGVRHFCAGDRGVSEWTFRGTKQGTSEAIERRGCDVFTFRDGKIHIKDTYQKVRQPVNPRQEVQVPAIHKPVGRYAHAVKYRDLLYVSGCGPFDKQGDIIGAGDIAAQTRATFDNIKAILEAAGTDFSKVIKETVYLTNIDERQVTRAIREQFYGETLPASTLIEISACVMPEMKIEIDVVAWL
jgi:reactive intermediate/imine deaminase